MDESTKSSPCKDCQDIKDDGLHDEVEHLRKSLIERDAHIEAFETEFIKCNRKTRDLEEQVDTWREKYERLYDSHKRVQKLNQGLEDKLLQMVDKMKGEKSQLTRDIATLSVRLAESKHNYSLLQKENERYKNDMNLAIQLLQCKPDHFVSQKLDNLPADTQARVSQYVMSKSRPTSATQSKNGNELETFDASEYEFNISASLMTKILEDSIQDTVTKHCDTCTCSSTQNKPFCYDDTYYSVATQTQSSGEMKNSLCLNCNSDMNSNISAISISPLHSVKLIRDRSPGLAPPMYFIPPKLGNISKDQDNHAEKTTRTELVTAVNKIDDMSKAEPFMQIHKITKIGEDLKHIRKSNGMEMEPAVHHKLCDRTRASISSIKSSTTSAGHEDLLIKDVSTPREIKPKVDNVLSDEVNINLRKNSLSSMGAISRASSIAKSTTSTHRSNTQVGPGPRFCSLRMQAGSKNILLDNAQPDVPPVLYRRQSKCNDNSIFKDLNDIENFVEMEKHDVVPMDFKNDNVVVESTLIDVHVDNNVRDTSVAVKNAPINPILMNVSSSPLQPQKTHNFSNCSEPNNNTAPSGTSLKNAAEIDNLLTEELNLDNNVNKSHDSAKTHDAEGNDIQNKNAVTPNDDRDVKIFNFDRYEQSKLNSQYSRPMRKIDMSQLHSLENTKISKDLPPAGDLPKLTKKAEIAKASLPAIVNVYPNLTQTHLKVNENKRGFTNEQSTSSLSSDDSAAILQKQQLLRVAEWVEQNLEQQNNFNDVTGEDEVNYKATDRENRISRLTETLNELALNMPHPVSKYSKSYTRAQNYSWVNDSTAVHNSRSTKSNPKPAQAVTSTIYPAENDKEDVSTKDAMKIVAASLELGNNLSAAIKGHGSNEISAEELARMEYNVKQFLLSGPQWVTPKASGSRRTSSKTETDV